VLEVAHRAAKRVRESGKPYAVEALTYRLVPHGAADFLEKYRTKEEVREWKQRDPIALVEHQLLESGEVTEEQIGAIRDEAKKLVDAAVTFADESPEPDLSELTTDVYASAD
jgi:pyruvate dehydrogenase E1 component alpha subunit